MWNNKQCNVSATVACFISFTMNSIHNTRKHLHNCNLNNFVLFDLLKPNNMADGRKRSNSDFLFLHKTHCKETKSL